MIAPFTGAAGRVLGDPPEVVPGHPAGAHWVFERLWSRRREEHVPRGARHDGAISRAVYGGAEPLV